MADIEVGSPEWWLARLIRKLGDRQDRYTELNNWVTGNHPLPDGDRRYVNALRDLQEKAKTNYISLIVKAVTQRMRVREFKFNGAVDDDAGRIWKANDMELFAPIAIFDGGKFGDCYALVSPPEPDQPEIPIITIEDPRNCVVERNPVRPTRTLAGLKFYPDDFIGRVVAVLYLPDAIYIYHGPKTNEQIDYDRLATRIEEGNFSAAGVEFVDAFDNPLGMVPLIYGQWQPETGLAECEDGAFEVQDRANHTMLARLIITKSQAYRQRMIAGVRVAQAGGTAKGKPPFDPGADAVWVTENKDAKVFDLEQADIKQILEAIRDDIGDLAALTQTPVTYLTNRMVNVSGDTLHAAQHSHVAKVRRRMDAMGWFFETIIKTCFRYLNDPRANEVDAEVQWADPEVRTLAELADMAAKFASTGIPVELIMERLGFSADEIERAVEIIAEREQQDREHDLAVKAASKPTTSNTPQEGNQ